MGGVRFVSCVGATAYLSNVSFTPRTLISANAMSALCQNQTLTHDPAGGLSDIRSDALTPSA